MSERSRRGYRTAIESLEDRAVPAIDLSLVGPQINAAFSAFAAGLRHSESSLITTGGTTSGTGGLSASAITSQAQAGLATLRQSLGTALGTSSPTSALVQQQLGVGGLSDQIGGIYAAGAAGAAGGVIPTSLLPTLFSAVDAAVLASYQQTAGDVFIGSATTRAGTASTGTIPITPVSSTTFAGQVGQAVTTLDRSLAGSLGLVPTASTVLQQELGPDGLQAQMLSIFNAASGAAGGTIAQAQLPLLFQSVEFAMFAAYQHAAGAIFLDASGQAKGSSIDLSTIGAPVNAAFSTFANAIRTAELGLYNPTPPPTPTPITPSLTATGFTTVASAATSTTANFVVNLSAASTSPVTVAYATGGGSAAAGAEYLAAAGTLTFAPGETTKDVPITILMSTPATTGTKTLILTLSSPTNATIATATATGNIVLLLFS